jgi:hypothetical protein
LSEKVKDEAMAQLELTLKLDSEKTAAMTAYDLYRREQIQGDRPVVDGLYIQRGYVGPIPPERMSVLLEWAS